MIKTFNDLVKALVACSNRMPEGATTAELRDWIDKDAEAQRLRAIHRVWMDAMDNPPEGVIGVGTITYVEQKMRYAEQKMREAQQDA